MTRVRTGRTTLLTTTAVLGCAALAGCTSPPPVLPDETPSATAVPTAPTAPWGQLAARVAAARDNRFVATYSLQKPGRPARTVSVTIAADGSWLVVVPGGALGGTADVAVAQTRAGLFDCTTSGSVNCFRVGDAGATLPARSDPRIEHLFTDWLLTLSDRDAAISVDPAPPPAGAHGSCFSVGPDSAALAMPVDAGIYCFDDKGTLTAAAVTAGTLMLVSGPVAAPPTVTLPGPVVPGTPLATAAPPASPSPTASAH